MDYNCRQSYIFEAPHIKVLSLFGNSFTAMKSMRLHIFFWLVVQGLLLLPEYVLAEPKEVDLNIVDLRSPYKRNATKLIVVHHTKTSTTEDALFQLEFNKTTSHFLVAKNGTIFQLLGEENIAWHVKDGMWRNDSKIDETSICIFMVNNGKEAYPAIQQKAIFDLISNLKLRYKILSANIVGGTDLRPKQKVYDPSYLFPWKDLYAHMGVFKGLYKTNLTKEEQGEVLWTIKKTRRATFEPDIRRFGYTRFRKVHRFFDQVDTISQFNAHFCVDFWNPEEAEPGAHSTVSIFSWHRLCQERLDYLLEHINE